MKKLRYFIFKKYQFLIAFIDIGTQLTIKDHLLAELEQYLKFTANTVLVP